MGKKEKPVTRSLFVSIQILQYEFLGPVSLDQWGPPMEKVVYLVLGRDKDSFQILYAGDCERTDEKAFFVKHPGFKCWVSQAGSEKSLYLAILPLFEAAEEQRAHILRKIISHYKPACNDAETPPPAPYRTAGPKEQQRQPQQPPPPKPEKTSCPCCGAEMKVDKVLEKTTIVRCTGCGISDTRLNS